MNLDICRQFMEHHIGHPIESSEIVYLTAKEVLETIWPINETFRPNLETIRSIPYDSSFESEADEAIISFIYHPEFETWDDLSDGAWRVLLERHMQAILVVKINEMADDPLIPIPEDLPESAWLGASMLFLHHEMKLPFPVENRSDFSLPPSGLFGSNSKH